MVKPNGKSWQARHSKGNGVQNKASASQSDRHHNHHPPSSNGGKRGKEKVTHHLDAKLSASKEVFARRIAFAPGKTERWLQVPPSLPPPVCPIRFSVETRTPRALAAKSALPWRVPCSAVGSAESVQCATLRNEMDVWLMPRHSLTHGVCVCVRGCRAVLAVRCCAAWCATKGRDRVQSSCRCESSRCVPSCCFCFVCSVDHHETSVDTSVCHSTCTAAAAATTAGLETSGAGPAVDGIPEPGRALHNRVRSSALPVHRVARGHSVLCSHVHRLGLGYCRNESSSGGRRLGRRQVQDFGTLATRAS
jgi:hypothetical protein